MFQTLIYIFVILLAALVEVYSMRTYDFKQICEHGGGTVQIPDDGQMLLSYYSSSPLKPNTTCVVSVYNRLFTHSPTVIAYFNSFSTNYSPRCVQSRMDIFDGNGTNPQKALTGPNGVCGSWANTATYYNSTSPYMTFSFREDTGRSRFNIVLTSAHKGSCLSNEFNCGNGFCIRDSLTCNGYNNCGNNFDEIACAVVLAVGTIVAIVFAVIIGVICIPVFVVCLVCQRRRPRRMAYRNI